MATKFNPLMIALLVGGAFILTRGGARRTPAPTGGLFGGGGGGGAQPIPPTVAYDVPFGMFGGGGGQIGAEDEQPDAQPYIPYAAPAVAPIDWANIFAGLGAFAQPRSAVITDPVKQTIIKDPIVPTGGTSFPQQIIPWDLQDTWLTPVRTRTTTKGFTPAYPGEKPLDVYFGDEYDGATLVPTKTGSVVITEPDRNLFAGLGDGDGDYFGVDYEFPAAGEDEFAWEGIPSSGGAQPESASEDEQRTDPQTAFDAGRFDTFYDE